MLNNAAEYERWRKKTLAAPTASHAAGAATMVTRAVIELLASDQFYGEVLTRLPREAVTSLNAPFALAWRDNRLTLQVAAQPLAQTFTRFDSLQAGLKHVALHVIWQHPLRYRERVQSQRQLVTLATDLAVNQYVHGLPANATGLATVQPLVKVRLPLKADSGTYLRLLRERSQSDPADPQPGTTAPDQEQGPHRPRPSTGQREVPIDDPASWSGGTGQLTNPNLAASRLQQLTKDAWAATNEAGRGLVAGHVVAELQRQRAVATVDWRRLLVRGVGQLLAGKRPSHARFDRRQPARMELPGQVSDPRLDLQVYVDNSGSVSDQTLQALLAQVAALTRSVPARITVKPFDAVIQPGQTYRVDLPQQVRFVRRGGGGTVYQSIFDDLARHHQTNGTTLALILTDGRGEERLDSHHFTNVIWLLAHATDRLSVRPRVGKVVNLNLGSEPHE